MLALQVVQALFVRRNNAIRRYPGLRCSVHAVLVIQDSIVEQNCVLRRRRKEEVHHKILEKRRSEERGEVRLEKGFLSGEGDGESGNRVESGRSFHRLEDSRGSRGESGEKTFV